MSSHPEVAKGERFRLTLLLAYSIIKITMAAAVARTPAQWLAHSLGANRGMVPLPPALMQAAETLRNRAAGGAGAHAARHAHRPALQGRPCRRGSSASTRRSSRNFSLHATVGPPPRTLPRLAIRSADRGMSPRGRRRRVLAHHAANGRLPSPRGATLSPPGNGHYSLAVDAAAEPGVSVWPAVRLVRDHVLCAARGAGLPCRRPARRGLTFLVSGRRPR